jgi:hypothetical protein
MKHIIIEFAKYYQRNPKKYMDIIRLETDKTNKAVLVLAIALAIHGPINHQTGLVEKYKPQFLKLGLLLSLTRKY